MKIEYSAKFIRQGKKLDRALQDEIIEKVNILTNKKNHEKLKVHKLKGRLYDRYSFSVNYRIRIIFMYFRKDLIILLSVGDHDVYDQ